MFDHEKVCALVLAPSIILSLKSLSKIILTIALLRFSGDGSVLQQMKEQRDSLHPRDRLLIDLYSNLDEVDAKHKEKIGQLEKRIEKLEGKG